MIKPKASNSVRKGGRKIKVDFNNSAGTLDTQKVLANPHLKEAIMNRLMNRPETRALIIKKALEKLI